jgi:SAM-dependent methyltransferase
MRWRFGYFTPDDFYEAVLSGLVTPDTRWLDVGCGRNIFPSNLPLSRELSSRCRRLVGVDPDQNILENPYVHTRIQSAFEDLQTDERFDLVTMRMVAEHVTDPRALVAKVVQVLAPNGRVVIYTVFKWSPSAILAGLAPSRIQHGIKRFLWRTDERDTFPVVNRLNTRGLLRSFFTPGEFQEECFAYLDDCRTLQRFRVGQLTELVVRKLLRMVRLPYPDLCILGVYRKL